MYHATADDDANAACLPPDVLANVFLRLPASDLCRFRRVCKEWHGVISDPVFVNEHMEHGPWGLTHTVVFLRGRGSSVGADGATTESRNGQGFLFNKHWRLVATFTAGESEDLVGTSNGLMCFLDVHHSAISVVEPFTGESLALPLPPTKEWISDPSAYCFGFDPASRRYKIVHLGLDYLSDGTSEQDVYVYTIGGGGGPGESWRSVRVAGADEPGVCHRNSLFAADGSVCWSVNTEHLGMLARFNLATEEITTDSEPIIDYLRVEDTGTAFHVMATDSDSDSDTRSKCVMTVGSFGEWGMFFMGDQGRQSICSGLKLKLRRLALPQALQRGHLLLEDYDGVYIHPIPPPPASNDLGMGKLLLKIDKDKDKEPTRKSNTRGLFVPALLNQVPAMVGPDPQEQRGVATFCYAPPLSPTPLAHRCGFMRGSPQTLAENKVTM